MRYNYVWLGLITPDICKLRMDNAWTLSLTKCWLYVVKNAPRSFHPKNFDIPKKMIINACRSCWWFCQILNQIKRRCLTLAFLVISVQQWGKMFVWPLPLAESSAFKKQWLCHHHGYLCNKIWMRLIMLILIKAVYDCIKSLYCIVVDSVMYGQSWDLTRPSRPAVV